MFNNFFPRLFVRLVDSIWLLKVDDYVAVIFFVALLNSGQLNPATDLVSNFCNPLHLFVSLAVYFKLVLQALDHQAK